MKGLLRETVNAIQMLENKTSQNSNQLQRSTLFVRRAKEVIVLIDSWAKHHAPARLRNLVEGMHRLSQVEDFQNLLSIIPNQIMDPSSRRSLLNTISKVARYREAARSLYRTAKKIPLVRKMKLFLVELPQNSFEKPSPDQSPSTFSSTISRISPSHGQAWNVDHICHLLAVSETEANDRLAQSTRKTLKDSKVHAEIQLLFYSELRNSKLPPRVICSTKDACFLCNAFISMHGKIHTPRTHGRLYPGWRLPFSPILKEVEQRFNMELATQIRTSLTTLLLRRKKTVYPDPNESTLLTLPVSVSTLRSLGIPVAVNGAERQLRPRLQPRDYQESEVLLVPVSDEKLSNLPEQRPIEYPPLPISEVSTKPSNELPPQNEILSLYSPSELSSDSTNFESHALLQGQPMSMKVQTDKTSYLFAAGPFEVWIDNWTRQTQLTPDSQQIDPSFSIEWLTFDQVETVREQYPSLCFDVESLVDEISLKLNDLNCFYITARGFVLKFLVL